LWEFVCRYRSDINPFDIQKKRLSEHKLQKPNKVGGLVKN